MGLDVNVLKVIEPTESAIADSNDDGYGAKYRRFLLFDDESPRFEKLKQIFADRIIYFDHQRCGGFDEKLIELGYTREQFCGYSPGEAESTDETWYVDIFVNTGGMAEKIENVAFPVITEKQPHLICEEIGYQRKGANKSFYTDGLWDEAVPVADLATLREHHAKYFSGEIIAAPSGGMCPEDGEPFGYNVEYAHTPEEARKNFQENIIDNFIEGQTFVMYW